MTLADAKQRFSNRVADYLRYRPGYPPAVLDLLRLEREPRAANFDASLSPAGGWWSSGMTAAWKKRRSPASTKACLSGSALTTRGSRIPIRRALLFAVSLMAVFRPRAICRTTRFWIGRDSAGVSAAAPSLLPKIIRTTRP